MKSLYTKIMLGFSAILLLLIFLSGVNWYNSNHSNSLTTKIINEDMLHLSYLDELRFNVMERISSARAYLLYGDVNLKNKFLEDTKKSQDIEKKLLKLANDEERPLIQKIVNDSNEWGNQIEQTVFTIYDQGKKEQAIQNNSEVKKKSEALMDSILQVQAKKQQQVENQGKEIIDLSSKSEKLTIILTLISLLVGFILSWQIARKIVNPILQVAKRLEQIARGDLTDSEMTVSLKDEIGQLIVTTNYMSQNLRELIGQVSYTSQQVAASSEQLTASAEQTSEASSQISMAIQDVAQGAETQNDVTQKNVESMNDMNHRVKQGSDSIEAAMTQMKSINQSVEQTSHLITQLGVRSQEIGEIVEVITDIAEQTNLLALNAAIEAARAGEHGKGFAVVADEVRKLAEQSERSALQIEKLIQSIQKDTESAVISMNLGTKEVQQGIIVVIEAGNQFQQISEITEQMMKQIEKLSIISKQSSSNIQQVASSSEEQLATMEEITSSALALSKMAEGLQQVVYRFKI